MDNVNTTFCGMMETGDRVDCDFSCMSTLIADARSLVLEPFYGGSHKQLVDLLVRTIPSVCTYTMSAKKWHWRQRTAALYFAQIIPEHHPHLRTIFSSCVLNVAELVALRPDLRLLHHIIYFHENQLNYPTRKQQEERDFQYGYNQVLSCLVADEIVFNSLYNLESFLSNISAHFKTMPDYRPKGLVERIRPKCRVLYFPMEFPSMSEMPDSCTKAAIKDDLSVCSNSSMENAAELVALSVNVYSKPLHIVWPHRWEHDKNPELLFDTLYHLIDEGLMFQVSVLGQTYTLLPPCFEEARGRLEDHILHWGYVDSKTAYFNILRSADVVVSTAEHEFFGISMLEAAYLGCYPLCPNRLVYPEIFPAECLYNTREQLCKRLRSFCKRPWLVKRQRPMIDFKRYSWENLQDHYVQLFSEIGQSPASV